MRARTHMGAACAAAMLCASSASGVWIEWSIMGTYESIVGDDPPGAFEILAPGDLIKVIATFDTEELEPLGNPGVITEQGTTQFGGPGTASLSIFAGRALEETKLLMQAEVPLVVVVSNDLELRQGSRDALDFVMQGVPAGDLRETVEVTFGFNGPSDLWDSQEIPGEFEFDPEAFGNLMLTDYSGGSAFGGVTSWLFVPAPGTAAVVLLPLALGATRRR
jgi:hypothetical protein